MIVNVDFIYTSFIFISRFSFFFLFFSELISSESHQKNLIIYVLIIRITAIWCQFDKSARLKYSIFTNNFILRNVCEIRSHVLHVFLFFFTLQFFFSHFSRRFTRSRDLRDRSTVDGFWQTRKIHEWINNSCEIGIYHSEMR